ncbi:hypothetical protein QBC47DRAFT_307999 [Echria macrotheca]|uniref:Uncharacterized protein n=1 Tax=Echria macrotheca TaxID=438768 RepID=A0AAJ0F2T7_9PEZI|nr:hypothetical protein QBC47DRAFT_307999 [Echria macrotheca]
MRADNGIPSEELWDEIEANYWASMREVRAAEDAQLDAGHRAERKRLDHQTAALVDSQSSLVAERAELLRRLEAINGELHKLEVQKSNLAHDVTDLERRFKERRHALYEERVLDDTNKREMLREYRRISKLTKASQGANGNEGAMEAPPVRPVSTHQEPSESLSGTPRVSETGVEKLPVPDPQQSPQNPTKGPQEVPDAGSAMDVEKLPVLLVDADGAVVERLQRINVTSHWVDYVLDLPIKRTATLRRGKRLSKEALESIYAVGNSKVSKWLSCYIQATGEIQDVPCQTCARGSGPFQECVVLPNSDYLPRCGNCEWSRLACNLQTRPRSRVGSSSEATGPTKAPKKKQAENQEPVKSGFTPINDSARASPVGQAADESGSKPARDAQKAPSGFETPASTTPLDGTPAPEADDSEAALPEITKATLTLRDNGVIFTDPPCMRGVPLAKISPEHEYWDKSWEPIEPIVEANLQKWKDKYESHVAAGASQSSKFLANRQINRGNSILKFLEEGEFHPYQLFGKEYVTRFLTGYDTLFRMVQTLEELGKFYIDVAPSQWLRQRLVEICEEQGTAFVLSRTVHGLYHDKKLIALRAKSGFGNIGRPSGYKFDKPGGSAKKSGKGSKRKEVPEAQQPAQPSPQQQQPPPQSGPGSRSSQRRNRASPEPKAAEQTTPAREAKKQRLTSLPAREDLEYEGYTSSDSYSNDHVMPVDWRIYQVKTRDHSSSCDVTQYWHWVDKADGGGSEGDMFEHQVLRDMKNRRVLWGVYKEPINFHLRLSELTSVTYAPGTQKVVIGTRPIRTVKHRGDVMAYFKRERTKRRFLEFMQNKGVKLIRTNLASIESAWRTLESDVLPTSVSFLVGYGKMGANDGDRDNDPVI